MIMTKIMIIIFLYIVIIMIIVTDWLHFSVNFIC